MPRLFLYLLLVLAMAFTVSCAGDDDDDDNDNDDSEDDDDDSGDDDSGDDDDNDTEPPDVYPPVLPGPGTDGYNADLEERARLYDRQVHAFNAYGMGLAVDVSISEDRVEDRALIESFLHETDGWDFEEYSGKSPNDVIDNYWKTAGLYSGVNLAADAYRYGVLRDQGYADEEVEIARGHLLAGIETFHIATAITGVPGVIVRGLQLLDVPGSRPELTPLFDEYGNPLPEVKDNGTWRADNSGLYPNWIWEDSCSRDMIIGWMAAFGAIWEVIQDDPEFDQDIKDRMIEDATAIGHSLMTVRDSGFDLEIWDADDRATFHAYMNENNFDRIYLPFLPIKNGMYAGMALGSIASLVYVTGDSILENYLYENLLGARKLHEITLDNQVGVHMGYITNFSGINMAFQGMWLAIRYIEDPAIRKTMMDAMVANLYVNPGQERMPWEMGQSLFDFMYAASTAGSSAYSSLFMQPDEGAVERGVQTLMEFDVPPFWGRERTNCDEQEIESGVCIGDDGTEFEVLGYVGRNGDLIVDPVLPMRIRPTSNYYWRSNPYKPNGGDGPSHLVQSVDFRYAYWLGRWSK